MKPEVFNSPERFTATENTDRVLLAFVLCSDQINHIQLLLRVLLILFRNLEKCFFIVLKMRKNLLYIKLQKFGVLSHLDQFVHTCTSKKFTKDVEFYIFEPQKCKIY